ncbi:MAG: ATP-binding cassette domain-containing protein [Moraxellaceae bacterium]
MLEFDLQLRRGEFALDMQARLTQPITLILGASGSGKSTLLALLSGLLKAESGYILLNQNKLLDIKNKFNQPSHLRRIGLMWQDGQLFPHLTVQQNIEYGYRLLKPEQRKIQPKQLIELLEIGHLLQRRPRHLSGGEKQRVALCRTLLASPELLLLDEPLTALNPSLKQPILAFLKTIPTQFGIPLLYVTHQLEDCEVLAGEVWQCSAGRLVRLNPSPQPSP